MKPVKTIFLGTLIIGTVALGASAYANRGGDGFQDRMIKRISERLELNDTQVMALNGLADELKETRDLMKGDGDTMRTEMSSLVNSSTFDQGKALSMINDRAAALKNNAPELVAVAAVFFDGLDASQKEKISEFAGKIRKGHRH
ncbi:MAG: protein CpxP [Granulosicoccus sp.]|jgi:protein CpxP